MNDPAKTKPLLRPGSRDRVLKRLASSASGYVRVQKFGTADKKVLADLILEGKVEIFDSPAGRAYRIKR